MKSWSFIIHALTVTALAALATNVKAQQPVTLKNFEAACGPPVARENVVVVDVEDVEGGPAAQEAKLQEEAGEHTLATPGPVTIGMPAFGPRGHGDHAFRKSTEIEHVLETVAEQGCDLLVVLKSGVAFDREQTPGADAVHYLVVQAGRRD